MARKLSREMNWEKAGGNEECPNTLGWEKMVFLEFMSYPFLGVEETYHLRIQAPFV